MTDAARRLAQNLVAGVAFLTLGVLLWLTANVYITMRRVLFVLSGGCL